MEGDYNLNGQDVRLCEAMRVGEDHLIDQQKDYCEIYDEGFEEDDGSTIFRPVRGRGSFRARGRPPATWVKAPPMRFRGRGGYPPAAPRGYYRRFPFEPPWGQPGVMAPPYGMPPMMPMGCQLPNMSQPPPPYMPPPAAPPVNPPPPELWVETNTETGQTYYYHAKTREAKWTRPEGPACKVITQADIEAMAAAVRRKNAESMTEQKMEDKMELVDPLQTTIEEIKMTDVHLSVPPPQVASYPGWWAPPALAPPLLAHAPPDKAAHPDVATPQGAAMGHQLCRAALGLHEPARVADTPPDHVRPHDTMIPETLAAAAGAWSTHRAPDGRPYYYHAETQQSVWEKPHPLREWEGLQAKIAAAKGEKVERRNKIDVTDLKITATIDLDATEDDAIAAELSEMEREKDYKERSERLKESVRVNMGLEANTNGKQNAVSTESKKTTEEDLIGVLSDSEPESKKMATCPVKSANPNNAAQTDQSKTLAQKQTPEKAATKETEEKQKEKSEGEKTTEGQKETNKRGTLKVVSITTINGSPWCVVWADDGRVFYYDNLARTSVWKRPAALLNRDDVDGILANPPPGLNRRQSSEGAAAPAAKPTPAVNGEKKAETAADSEKEKEKEKESSESSSSPAEDAEAHEARLRSFLAMLYDKQVSAFSTWENELHKIIFDARYQTLDTKERRQVFDQYVKEISENKWRDRKDRGTQRRLAFRALLEEAALQPKSTFAEFVAKYGGDDRFTEFDKPKNREGLFNEFLAEVKRREKEADRVRELVKIEFIGLLREKGVDRHARYNDIKKKIESDARYKAVDGGAMREDYFREYCKQLKDDRKKDKDHKDHSKKERKREKKEKELLNQQKPPADDKKQPTPPPDQWAEILGIPTRGDTKQLRNRRKSPEKVPIKSPDKLSKLPPKKRHLSEELKPPEIVPSPSNNKKKTSEKKKRKKTEKE